MKKFLLLALALLIATSVAVACTTGEGDETTASTDSTSEDTGSTDTTAADETTAADTEREVKELDSQKSLSGVKTATVDTETTYQTIESFGASGAWWAQYVGGWDTVMNTTGMETREYIAMLLFDDENGIGLNSYRYNIGAGSRDKGHASSLITDSWRRAYSFLDEDGNYDWTRDANAVWMMNRAVDYGVDEIVMFVNSPLESLTISGSAYAISSINSTYSNLDPENYEAFAEYVLDVVEHFALDEGLPVKFVSPVNEPQWTWTDASQEGCHYEPDEVVELLKVFLSELEEREELYNTVTLSAPEGGDWNSDSREYITAILKDDILSEYFTSFDLHSYWSDSTIKTEFATAYAGKKFSSLTFRMSEWCEMTNGVDTTMDSAINLAEQIYEDMTILDCVSWQYWIAVSCYDYRDGLIYVDSTKQTVTVPKRLWAMGNYSRFIDRGYERVDVDFDVGAVDVSAYKGTNEYGEEEIVLVFINQRTKSVNVDFSGLDTSKYTRISVNVTSDDYNLEETYYAEFLDGTAVSIPGQSVTTVVISEYTGE